MNTAICRVVKFSAPKDIVGLQIHNRRERTKSNSNPNIDFSKSKNNYRVRFTPGFDNSYNDAIDDIIYFYYTGKKSIRKDAVRCCEILFTASGDFFEQFPEQTESFFIDCYYFAANRFGADNIVDAIVHVDEQTPHMHLDFVPLTSDGRLSAKSVLGGKREMQALQDDFWREVGQKYGLERGTRADLDAVDRGEAAAPRQHVPTWQLKQTTATELIAQTARTEAAKAEEERAKKRTESLSTTISDSEKKLSELSSKNAALEKELNDKGVLLEKVAGPYNSKKELRELDKRRKPALPGDVALSQDDYNQLLRIAAGKAAADSRALLADARAKEAGKLAVRAKELERERDALRQEVEELRKPAELGQLVANVLAPLSLAELMRQWGEQIGARIAALVDAVLGRRRSMNAELAGNRAAIDASGGSQRGPRRRIGEPTL